MLSRRVSGHRSRDRANKDGDAELMMPSEVENERVRAGVWLGFLAMCLGMFMAVLDIQIVASSLPAIQKALAIASDKLSWVQTAYLIAEIVAIPLTARLTRLLTLGGLFVAAVA